MRGTSRREDAAFWIISLSELREVAEDQHGAKFAARFVKNRNATGVDCPPLEWRFLRSPNEQKATVKWEKISGPDFFRKCVEEGMTTATEIADEMGITRGQVSRYAGKGIKEGWLKKKNRQYILNVTEQGNGRFFKEKIPTPQRSSVA
jgi:hypothetical protein